MKGLKSKRHIDKDHDAKDICNDHDDEKDEKEKKLVFQEEHKKKFEEQRINCCMNIPLPIYIIFFPRRLGL